MVGATLTVVSWDLEDAGAGDGLGGEPFDTKLFLDGIEVTGAFDDTFSPDVGTSTPSAPNTTVFHLGSEFFPLFSDGGVDIELNAWGGQFQDCLAVDYAMLQLDFAVTVSIDIKPGSYPNSINKGSGGNVPVAIFSSSTFDATTVEPESVTLASAPVKLKGKGTPMAATEDVNGDGLLDLVVHVDTETLQINETDTDAVLEGKTTDGTPIRGIDSIRVVP